MTESRFVRLVLSVCIVHFDISIEGRKALCSDLVEWIVTEFAEAVIHVVFL